MNPVGNPQPVAVEPQQGGLRANIEQLNTNLERIMGDPKKAKKIMNPKPFKLPFSKTFGSPAKIRKGNVLVQFVKTNGDVTFDWFPIEDDMVQIKYNKNLYAASAQYILRYRRFPLLIIPEWSLKPFSPFDHYIQTTQNKELAFPQKVIIEGSKRAALELKKKKSFGGMWIWILIGGAVLVFLITQLMSKNGGFKLF
jgi:hypothetical protein